MSLAITIGMVCFPPFINAYSNTSIRGYECDHYARDAVTQHKQNQQAHCGFFGLRWSNDKAGQAKWCATTNKHITDQETEIRHTMLNRCFKNKALLSNTTNHPKLPQSCKDSTGKYTAIKSIYRHDRTHREVRTPVKNGLIRFDFNRDNHLDYVFIEQNKQHGIQLTTCISGKNSSVYSIYKRKPTVIRFKATLDELLSYGHYISLKKQRLHIEFTYLGHNEGSSSAEGYYAYHHTQKKFELKKSSSHNGGLLMEPEYKYPYPIYIPTPPKVL
jgi:hypothetical protein